MRNKTVNIPIYFGKLTMIITNSWREIDLLYNTKIDDNLYDAVVFEMKEDEYIVAIKKVEWSVIAHEVVHIVNAIFLKCGIELDRHNDEPQAYLTGWIVNEIDKHLKEQEEQTENDKCRYSGNTNHLQQSEPCLKCGKQMWEHSNQAE